VNLFPAHRTQAQDRAGLRLRTLPERIEEELHSLPNGFVRRGGLDVRRILPSRAGDIDCNERQDTSVCRAPGWVLYSPRLSSTPTACLARKRQHPRKSRKQIHCATMWALIARHVQGQFHLIQSAPYVSGWNRPYHQPAFVAPNVRLIATVHWKKQTTAIGIAEVEMGKNVFGGTLDSPHNQPNAAGNEAPAWRMRFLVRQKRVAAQFVKIPAREDADLRIPVRPVRP